MGVPKQEKESVEGEKEEVEEGEKEEVEEGEKVEKEEMEIFLWLTCLRMLSFRFLISAIKLRIYW